MGSSHQAIVQDPRPLVNVRRSNGLSARGENRALDRGRYLRRVVLAVGTAVHGSSGQGCFG